MPRYNFWQQDSELYMASRAHQGQSSSQPQQILPSVPVNSDEDSPSDVTQHYPMNHGESTSNDEFPTPAHLHHEGFSQSDSLSPSDMTHSFLEIDQHDIHSASGKPPHDSSFNHFHFCSSDDSSANNPGFYGNVIESSPIEVHHHPAHVNQSESHASNRSVICKWNDGHGPCDEPILEAEIGSHVPSCHLPPPKSPPAKCRWAGCNNPKPMRRDTILRHIRQIHLGINTRRIP